MSEPSRYPGRPIELPMQPEPLEPIPTAGCHLCTLLDVWRTVHKDLDHRAHDLSRAVDCSVEINNHPHDPPRMTLPTTVPAGSNRTGSDTEAPESATVPDGQVTTFRRAPVRTPDGK
ncbi:hypothetical protein [Streptomyces sp. NPDC020965]|uniref:hypothetical protein n=1 Tax=Streptomyces sp. NPDC020965 TaxID=3365105 RepID=UPI0037A9D33B